VSVDALLPPELSGLFPYRSHWLAVPAGRYHYVDEGPRAAAPLLCVHGNPTWSFYWRSLVQAFRGDARVVVPDHIGCGGSDKPERFPYTLREHVDNLERLVLALDLTDITLVVHDWGGAIGMGLAARHPGRIARLVITNTAAFADPRVPLRIRACRAPGLGAVLVRGLDAFAGLAPRMAVRHRMDPDVERAMRFPYRGFIGSDRPLMLVLGDGFVYTHVDPLTGRVQLVRDRGINSSEELRVFLAENPSIATGRGQRYTSMMQKSIAIGMSTVLRLVNHPGRQIEVRARDDLQA
jgi:pimeloyl-ACP methyl ester carboxylesterase